MPLRAVSVRVVRPSSRLRTAADDVRDSLQETDSFADSFRDTQAGGERAFAFAAVGQFHQQADRDRKISQTA
jgi:hypothetical protein